MPAAPQHQRAGADRCRDQVDEAWAPRTHSSIRFVASAPACRGRRGRRSRRGAAVPPRGRRPATASRCRCALGLGSSRPNQPARPEAATAPRTDRPRRAPSTRRRSESRCPSTATPPGAQPEPAEHQQRLLPEGPPRREDAELGGGVVHVEEGADAQEPLARELAVEDARNDDEVVRGG